MTTHDFDGDGRTTTGGDANAFASHLARLKEEGGNLLVVGALPTDVHVRACESLFGNAADQHRRLLALIGHESPDLDRRLPDGVDRDPDRFAVVEADYATRGTATASPSAAPPEPPVPDSGPVVHVPGGDLPLLVERIDEAVLELTEGGTSPEPLRVCVDGLVPLFAQHDRGDVISFCHVLTSRIEDVGGRGHFHLRTDRDDDRVAALVPSFDVVVELAVEDGTVRQRWHTRDGDDSGWLPL